jgi:hypothetical protein
VLDVELGGVVDGRLRCAWPIPRSAKGKRVYGFVGVRAGGTQVTKNFSLRVR